jgi:hypothetical protein
VLRIRIGFNADPDPAFEVNANPDTIWFWIQGFITCPKIGRSFQPSKESIQHFKNIIFTKFFSIFVGNFCSPGSGSCRPNQSVSGSATQYRSQSNILCVFHAKGICGNLNVTEVLLSWSGGKKSNCLSSISEPKHTLSVRGTELQGGPLQPTAT